MHQMILIITAIIQSTSWRTVKVIQGLEIQELRPQYYQHTNFFLINFTLSL